MSDYAAIARSFGSSYQAKARSPYGYFSPVQGCPCLAPIRSHYHNETPKGKLHRIQPITTHLSEGNLHKVAVSICPGNFYSHVIYYNRSALIKALPSDICATLTSEWHGCIENFSSSQTSSMLTAAFSDAKCVFRHCWIQMKRPFICTSYCSLKISSIKLRMSDSPASMTSAQATSFKPTSKTTRTSSRSVWAQPEEGGLDDC